MANSAVIIQGGKTGSGCCKVKVKTCKVPGPGEESAESFQHAMMIQVQKFPIKINCIY